MVYTFSKKKKHYEKNGCLNLEILPELQMGNFNKRLMLGFRRTVCIVTVGGGIAAVAANSFE